MKKYLATVFLLSLLTACGQQGQTAPSNLSNSKNTSSSSVTVETSSNQSDKIKQDTETTTTQTQEQTEASSSSDDANSSSSEQPPVGDTGNVHYNGSYYSVQGKYGEVIIANKKHPLASSYAPGENPEALAAFQSLIADMQAQGFAISNQYSGFRSYETQTWLYQSYVNQDGQAEADTYSARPGYSEHQTGLAFDLLDSAGNLLEEPTATQWLATHAHQYGFVVRYLPGKEASTGYMAEAWHLRYIGQEATDIYNSGLTLEEYYGVAGGDYQ